MIDLLADYDISNACWVQAQVRREKGDPEWCLTEGQARAIAAISRIHTGPHNLHPFDPWSASFRDHHRVFVRLEHAQLDTYDMAQLTHLVMHAHRLAVRVGVSAERVGQRALLVISAFPRQPTDTGPLMYHPTTEHFADQLRIITKGDMPWVPAVVAQ